MHKFPKDTFLDNSIYVKNEGNITITLCEKERKIKELVRNTTVNLA